MNRGLGNHQSNYVEICINLVYVESAVLQAGLSDQERIGLVKRFSNHQDPPLVLIVMHEVSAQGVNLNLDTWWSRVIVVTNASNSPTRMAELGENYQSISFIGFVHTCMKANNVQVSQKEPVLVIRRMVLKSHYQHRESITDVFRRKKL